MLMLMRVLMLMHVTMLPPLCARFNEKAMIVHRCLARGTCGQCVLFGNAAMLSLLCYLYTATFAIYTMLSILCYLWHTILAMLLLVLLLLPLLLLLLLLLLLDVGDYSKKISLAFRSKAMLQLASLDLKSKA